MKHTHKMVELVNRQTGETRRGLFNEHEITWITKEGLWAVPIKMKGGKDRE